MNRRFAATLASLMMIAAAAPVWAEEAATGEEARAISFFEREVRPVLAERCYECHGVERQRSDLRLDHIDFILQGGETGEALAPGDVEGSRLIEAVRYENVDFQMPPRSKLPDDEIEVLEKWVAMGAPWPDEQPRQAADGQEFDLDKRLNEHWSWQPVQRPAVPGVEQTEAVGNAIDAFIVARLEKEGLSPSPQADRRTLIRRLYFDLVGLPPTPREVEAFVNDESPQAYEALVDRLLASPHFGERWARHWMDLVRYSETHGHQYDYPINHAWPYRDYLIRAFNEDVPYDQFVTEHIAGDLLEKPRTNAAGERNESAIATAFFWFGEAQHGPVDVRADQADRIDNQIDVMSKTFMGLTVSCARCHDHMFDAISTKDYYALYGIMASSRRDEAHLDRDGAIAEADRRIAKLQREADAALAEAMPTAEATAAHVEKYLAGVLAVVEGEADAAAVAEAHDLDEAMLERWMRALRQKPDGDAASDPVHPLRQALADPTAQPIARDLREQLQGQLAGRAAMLKDGSVFADFSEDATGWRRSGQAFDPTPTVAGRFDAQTGGPMRPNVAYSAVRSPQMRGTLRSPTFTIDSDFIHYRAAGRHGQVRLIIDNYHIDVFNPNLFHGMHFSINMADEDEPAGFRWFTQDVSKYRGHRAYIEIIDDGATFWNGGRARLRNYTELVEGRTWVMLDEVVFSNTRETTAVNPLADRLGRETTASTSAALTKLYAKWMGEAVTQWRSAEGEADLHELLSWAWQRDLLPRGEPRRKLAKITERLRQAQADVPEPMRTLATADGNGIDERVFVRGSHENLGDLVPRRFLEAIAGADQPPMPGDGSGRLELARRMTDPGNPFHSRVIVNRLWHHLFGRGIVASVDDFGAMGTEPTHPQLLDHLATRFLDEGQSLKRMIRYMVTSKTYRMASRRSSEADQVDPTNQLLHRMPMRRLQGEAIRDAMLKLSGRLDERLGGPSVEVHLTEFMSGRGRPGKSGPLDGEGRRSVYTRVRRNFLPPMMLAFDMPLPVQPVGRRDVSNVPAQALILLNDPFVVQQARQWAQRILSEHADDPPAKRIERMYEAAYARQAEPHEVERAVRFVEQQAAAMDVEQDDAKVWADLAHVMMNVKEFIFIK